jgi:hypothetical protein
VGSIAAEMGSPRDVRFSSQQRTCECGCMTVWESLVTVQLISAISGSALRE